MDEDDIIPELLVLNPKKTYSKPFKNLLRTSAMANNVKKTIQPAEKALDLGKPLTTKVAVEYLLNGKLNTEVCRYCLNIVAGLSELDLVMQIAGTGTMYKVTIREMIACFYPVKVCQDQNFPEKICQRCLDRAISAYLFTQQCEQAERALRNCLNDMHDKLEKLDPMDRPKKRGRQKLNPNYNVLYAEHENVIDYAEPIRNIVNIKAEPLTREPQWNELECKKCWQVLPNMESLMNHENLHPKSMWYHCRLCGKSFVKHTQLKKHHNQVHLLGKKCGPEAEKIFTCKECGNVTESYVQHLQHIEKHKFKTIMKYLIEKKTDRLCMICLNKAADLVELDKIVSIHGGYPELLGDTSLYTILASTLPNINYLHDFIGTKLCEKCLNHAITSYIFIHQFNLTRERLNLCVSLMLNYLKDVDPNVNVFVQVSPPTITAPPEETNENLPLDEDFIDESKLQVEVLEDEFRTRSDSDNESDLKSYEETSISPAMETINNPAKNVTRTYSRNKKLLNGLQNSKYPVDVCSEFLTFNKKKKLKKVWVRFTCPVCSKHFISDYFLKRHILKHVNRKVECNICHLKFQSKFYLYEHTKMTHLLNYSFYISCKVCGRTFTNGDKLQSHEKNHRKKPCELCNKIYASQAHYENHVQRHSVKLKLIKQKRAQTCSFCEKECTNDNELSLHVNKIHLQIKPYNCDMCERQFYTENNMKNHKKVHSMPSREKCEFCNKTLRSRKQLVIHVRKHIGAKPFCCQVCGQAFYSAFKAREHMKIYHGGKFCCRICKSTFPTKYGLKDHTYRDHSII